MFRSGACAELWRSRRERIDNYETYAYVLDVIDVDLFQDGAIVFGKVTFEGTGRMSREKLGSEYWKTLVLRKRDSRWEIIHSHESSVTGEDRSG